MHKSGGLHTQVHTHRHTHTYIHTQACSHTSTCRMQSCMHNHAAPPTHTCSTFCTAAGDSVFMMSLICFWPQPSASICTHTHTHAHTRSHTRLTHSLPAQPYAQCILLHQWRQEGADRQVGRQTGRWAGRQAGWQTGKETTLIFAYRVTPPQTHTYMHGDTLPQHTHTCMLTPG